MEAHPRPAFIARYVVIRLDQNTWWTGAGWSADMDDALQMSLKDADRLYQELKENLPEIMPRLDYIGLVKNV